MLRGLSRALAALALTIAVGAGCRGYQGEFRHLYRSFDGERAQVGCLDVSLSAPEVEEVDGVVLEYRFGNRCDSAVWVDFPSLAVVGRTRGGGTVALAPFDPNREIRVALLDGRAVGSELIEYRGPDSSHLLQACVDLRSFDRRPRQQEVLVCVDAPVRPSTGTDTGTDGLVDPYADPPPEAPSFTAEVMP